MNVGVPVGTQNLFTSFYSETLTTEANPNTENSVFGSRSARLNVIPGVRFHALNIEALAEANTSCSFCAKLPGEGPAGIGRRRRPSRELDRRGGRLITLDDDGWPALAMRAFTTARPDGTVLPRTIRRWCCGRSARWGPHGRSPRWHPGFHYHQRAGHHGPHSGSGQSGRGRSHLGAFGIDGAAHRAASACEGVTVAVPAGGIDVPYPAGHSALLHRVATHG